jgi:DNA-binding PadR family transcriptional regulator
MAVFGHGQLRLYLLSLLATGPRHGYELITALSDRFGGTYRPSAGTIYPRLARLEAEGLVERTASGRKTLYALTERGRQELADHGEELTLLERELAATVRDLAARVRAEVAGSMAGMRADVAAAAQQARAAAAGGAAGAAGRRGAGAGAWPGAGAGAGAGAGGEARARSDGGAAGETPNARARRRSQSRARRVQVETELATFRAEVRAALRDADALGEVPALTVDTVRTVLASARSAITATLPR